RAAEHERELAALRARMERKLEGGRFSLRRLRSADPGRSRELASMQRSLVEREEAFARQEQVLIAREQELVELKRQLERLAAPGHRRSQPPPAPRRQTPPRRRSTRDASPLTFADGLRALGGQDRPAGGADDEAGSW